MRATPEVLGRPALRLKFWLDRNDSGVWGDEPLAGEGTYVLRSTDQTADGNWNLSDPAVRLLTPTQSSSTTLVEGDLVMTKSSGSSRHIGKTTIVNAEVADLGASFGNFMQRLRCRPSVCPRFIWYLLNHDVVRSQFDDLSTTSTGLSNLNGGVIGEVNLPAVEPAEQRAIADFLDRETARIDTLIEEQQRLIDLLRERRESVADHLLGIKEAAHPLKRFVEDVTVGIVVNPSAWYAEDGVPALRGLNVRPGWITTTELVYLTPEGDEQHTKSRLRKGDVVVVRTGQAGAAAVVPPELDGTNAIDLLIVRPGSRVDPDFLAAYLNTPAARSLVAEGSVGAIQGHFNVGALRDLAFPDLSIGEQQRAATRWKTKAEQIDELIAESERFIELSRERRSALITAAVTGQIDVRDEVA